MGETSGDGIEIKPKFKGTLNEKLERVNKIHSEIQQEKLDGVRASKKLDDLLKKRAELEQDINNSLITGKERIKRPFLDYCFRCFSGSVNYINDGREYRTVFDKIHLLEIFCKQIKEFKGEKILVMYSNVPRETGIISNSCKFELEDWHPSMYVPVRKFFFLDTDNEKWIENKKNLNIRIDADIFRYYSSRNRLINTIWETDHSKEIYLGGPGPEETMIYIGTKLVEEVLERDSWLIKKIVKILNPYR